MSATFWILFHHEECPLCGIGDDWQERVYDRPKPEDPAQRHTFRYAACVCHFL